MPHFVLLNTSIVNCDVIQDTGCIAPCSAGSAIECGNKHFSSDIIGHYKILIENFITNKSIYLTSSTTQMDHKYLVKYLNAPPQNIYTRTQGDHC